MEISQEAALKRGRKEILLDQLRANESALGSVVADMAEFMRTLVSDEPQAGWQVPFRQHAERVALAATERQAIYREMRR